MSPIIVKLSHRKIVQCPEYRDNKNRTMLEMLPDVLGGQQGADLTARAGDNTLEHPQAVLVSNKPYGSGRMLDLGRRARLDQGALGAIAARMASTAQAVGPLRRAQYRSITRRQLRGRAQRGIQQPARSSSRPTPHHPGGHRRQGRQRPRPRALHDPATRAAGPAAPHPAPASDRPHPGSTGNDSGGSRSDIRPRPREVKFSG